MTQIGVCLYVAASCAAAVSTKDGSDYVSRVAELSRRGSPQGNPELEKFLKGLTRDQMVVAARQFCQRGEKTLARDKWAPATASALIAMTYYQEEDGSLSDASLDRLLAIIADTSDGTFFRFALATLVYDRYASQACLTDSQQTRVVATLSNVLRDRRSPEAVRHACCGSISGVLQKWYLRIVYSDAAVREVRRTGTKEQRGDIDGLVDSGKIPLAAVTKAQLLPKWLQVRVFREILTMIARDEVEPSDLRRLAQACLDSTAKLPLLNSESFKSAPGME